MDKGEEEGGKEGKDEGRKKGREGGEWSFTAFFLSFGSRAPCCTRHGVAGEPRAGVIPGFTGHILCGHGRVPFLLFVSLV